MPAKRKVGRPTKAIDIKQVEKLAKIQCTDEEMAAFFEMTRQSFNSKKKGEVLAAIERGRAKGRQSLRHAQFQAAERGNATMLIWLGKQLLGQRDLIVTEHTGEMTVNDGARERLLSKLAGLASAGRTSEDTSVVN